jgi:ferrous iron transport protein A
MKKLSVLKVGESGIIASYSQDDISIKLMEMGCVPGELIKIEQVAPLGGPICVTVAGYHLSLRLDEADNILIESLN